MAGRLNNTSALEPSIEGGKLISSNNSLNLAFLKHYMTLGISFLSILVKVQFSSVQLLSRVQLFVTPWTAAR